MIPKITVSGVTFAALACSVVVGKIVTHAGPDGLISSIFMVSPAMEKGTDRAFFANLDRVTGPITEDTTIFTNATSFGTKSASGKQSATLVDIGYAEVNDAVCDSRKKVVVDKTVSDHAVAAFASKFAGLYTAEDGNVGAGATYSYDAGYLDGKLVGRTVGLTFGNNFACGPAHKFTADEIINGFRSVNTHCVTCDSKIAGEECTKHVGGKHMNNCASYTIDLFDNSGTDALVAAISQYDVETLLAMLMADY